MLNADENRLYEKMAALLDEDDTLINLPGRCADITEHLYISYLKAEIFPLC